MKEEENIYVTRPYLPQLEKYEEYLHRIWNSGIITNKGPLYNELKEKLSILIKNENINLFCNGHNALECALKSLNMKVADNENARGEIITTPFTFVSTIHAIVNCGFKPVFCDINFDNLTIDVSKIENLINENTVAILGVHVYGFPCNVLEIQKIAEKYNLKVIYDAAHAFGVEINNKNILNFGDVSMVSFHATKLFNTIEGGMTVSKDKEIARKQELLQNFGISGYENVSLIGGNSKMNEFCAAMGLATIEDLDKIIEKRKQIVSLYKNELEDICGIKTFCTDETNLKQNYSYFPIIIDEKKYGKTRDEVYELLKSNNIFARKYFYPLTSEMDCYKNVYPEFQNSNLPTAKYVSERVLTLPLYYDLSQENVEKICKVLKR